MSPSTTLRTFKSAGFSLLRCVASGDARAFVDTDKDAMEPYQSQEVIV